MADRFFDLHLLQEAQKSGGLLALTVALSLLGGVFTVLQARYLSLIIGQVFLSGASLAGIHLLLLALLLAGLGRAAAIWGGDVAASRVAARVKANLRERLTSHLLTLGLAYTRGERTGELVNILTEGIEALDAYFSQYLPQIALAALVPVTILTFIAPLDLLSGIVLLLTAPLIPVFMILIGSLADAVTRRQWTALGRMSAAFLDALQGLTTLKLFNRSREQIRLIAENSDHYRRITLGVLRVTFLSALTLEWVATISTAVVAVQVGLRLLYGYLPFQEAFFVLILAPEFYGPLRSLGARFHAGMAGVTAAARIYEVLETPATNGRRQIANGKWQSGGSSSAIGYQLSAIGHQPSAIRFSDVSYTYPNASHPALDGVSFEIRSGEKVALVGPSGGGKSTIAQLLLGFIAPTAGEITFQFPVSSFQFPVSSFQPPASSFQAAWVPQLPYLFNVSVADNIRLGRPDASIDEVIGAACLAHADAFIRALPLGYDTVIGERGARLSGGQAQRIALGRAFLKDAPFIILDEATANLDPETEALIQESVGRLLEGRTALIIAHRLNTVRNADRIIVLDAGHMVEAGTHEELLSRRGAYWGLVNAWGETTNGRMGESANGRVGESANGRVGESANGRVGESANGRMGESANGSSGIEALAGGRRTERPAEASTPATSHAIRDTRYAIPNIHYLLSFLTPFWPLIALSVLLGFATVGSGIGLMATSAWIIASAALHPSIAVLQVAIVGVRFFGIARGLARYAERLASHGVTLRVLARLRVRFYAGLEPSAPATLMRYRSGDLLSRIVADIGTLENFYVRAVAPPFVATMVGLVMAVFLGHFNGRLVWAFLGVFLLAGVGVPLLSRLLSREPGRRLVATRGELDAVLVDGIQGVAELVAFGQEKAHVAHVRTLSGTLIGQQVRLTTTGALNNALNSFLTSLAVLVVLVMAIPSVRLGGIPGVDLAVLTLAVAASFEAVLPLSVAAQYWESSLAAAKRIFDIGDWKLGAGSWKLETGSWKLGAGSWKLETGSWKLGAGSWKLEAGSVAGQVLIPSTPAGFIQPPTSNLQLPISIQNLTFRYAPDEPLALKDVTLTVPAGRCVAVVGPSGAGKSTLVNLLARFWDYEEGSIRLGGRELRDIPPEAVRDMLSIVTQNTFLFNATIRDNLRLARPDATQEQIEAAARQAHVHDFIMSLPQGYDTWIGEQGLRLSGGERQRLAIGRALLRDAPILILDEATANLDALTERAVLETLAELMASRTTLMITHRLVGLENADEIVVLQGGQVVQRGHHVELLAADGVYQRLWEAAALGENEPGLGDERGLLFCP